MKHLRLHQHLTTWFALWVLLLGLTLPLLGHAGMSRFLGIGQPSADRVENAQPGTASVSSMPEWVSICTNTGMVWMDLADGSAQAPAATPAAPASDMAGGHCLYCLLHDEELALDVQAIWLVLTAFLPWQGEATRMAAFAPTPPLPLDGNHRPLQPRAPPQPLA